VVVAVVVLPAVLLLAAAVQSIGVSIQLPQEQVTQ
jgi:uncharacterized membrane protein